MGKTSGNVLRDSDGNTAKIENQSLQVIIEAPHKIPADYYLYLLTVTPSITVTAVLWDTVLTVDDTTGINVGDVITIYELDKMFQTLVMGTTATTITLGAGIDYEFTANAIVEVGIWNMNVDASSASKTFMIKAPPLSNIDVHSINVSMLDVTAMDDGLFGGMTQLTNGIIFRFIDGISKNLGLVVNNLGLWEIGFDTRYSDKAPSGQYGLKSRRIVPDVNGTTLHLTKGGASQFQLIAQDDLRGLILMAITINGHLE